MKTLLPLTITSLILFSIIPTAFGQPFGIKTGDRVRILLPNQHSRHGITLRKIIGNVTAISSTVLEIDTGQSTEYISLGSINRIYISRSKQRNLKKGLNIGTGAGMLVGGIIGAVIWQECTVEGWTGCFMHPETRTGAFAMGAVVGAIPGTVLGMVFDRVKKEKWHRVPIDITMERIQPRFKDSASKPMITVKWSFGKKKR